MTEVARRDYKYPYPQLLQNPTPKEQEIYHYYYGTPPGIPDAPGSEHGDDDDAATEEAKRNRIVQWRAGPDSVREFDKESSDKSGDKGGDKDADKDKADKPKISEKEVATIAALGVVGLGALALLHHRGNRYEGGRPGVEAATRAASLRREERRDRSTYRSMSRSGVNETDTSSSESESLGDDLSVKAPSLNTAEKRMKRLRRKQFLHTGFATLATISAIDTIASSTQARKHRIEAVKQGRMTDAESTRQLKKGTWQDVAGAGIAALGIQGAWEAFKDVRDLKKAKEEWEARREAYMRGRRRGLSDDLDRESVRPHERDPDLGGEAPTSAGPRRRVSREQSRRPRSRRRRSRRGGYDRRGSTSSDDDGSDDYGYND